MKLLPNKHLRRNLLDLHKNHPIEFGKFMVALRNLQESPDWSRICGIHGNTFDPQDKEVVIPTDPTVVEVIGNTPHEPFYCAHSETRFAAWHTSYIYEYELLLNKYNTSENKDYICLPYLYLTETPEDDYKFVNQLSIEVLFDGKKITMTNPLAAPNVYYFNEKGEKKIVQRNGFLFPATQDEKQKLKMTNDEFNNVLYAETYPTFSSNTLYAKTLKQLIDFQPLEIPHNHIHDYIGGPGGNMSDVPISAYDPLFWMHHCNVDRFFYNWLYEKTNQFQHTLPPPRIPKETLTKPLAPFKNNGTYDDKPDQYFYGWQNKDLAFMTVEQMINVQNFPYTYEKIEKKPFIFMKTNLELFGIPIPQESVAIYVYLIPKGVTLTDENKEKYAAGHSTWFGINRYLKNCKRCNVSRTNIKINVDTYLEENKISTESLGNYYWIMEAHGRLNQDENKQYKIYHQSEIIKDGIAQLITRENQISYKVHS